MSVSYRSAGVALWGDAGAFAYDTYKQLREAHYRELPRQLPIVIGITAYGHCLGLTRADHPALESPRISLESRRFAEGCRVIEDTLTHEMLHVWLAAMGRNVHHQGDDWYEAIRRLSPAVLGQDLDARRGAGRRSVRVPNPAYELGGDKPKTVIRKQIVRDAVQHGDVSRWPGSFRPDDYDWGEAIECPSY